MDRDSTQPHGALASGLATHGIRRSRETVQLSSRQGRTSLERSRGSTPRGTENKASMDKRRGGLLLDRSFLTALPWLRCSLEINSAPLARGDGGGARGEGRGARGVIPLSPITIIQDGGIMGCSADGMSCIGAWP